MNVQNLDPVMVNFTDQESGFMGIPRQQIANECCTTCTALSCSGVLRGVSVNIRSMTTMGTVMSSAGYSTHMVGKWDVRGGSRRSS